MRPQNNQAQPHTVLLLIEIFDTVTGILILTEACLVFLCVEFGGIVPHLQFLDIHYTGSQRYEPAVKNVGLLTFVDSVGDLVKRTAIAPLSDGLSRGEGGHCNLELTWGGSSDLE